jgi:hypothetical protein
MRFSPFTYYLAWQAPSWIAVAAALVLLRWLADLPVWILPVGVAVVIVKDLAMHRGVWLDVVTLQRVLMD